MIRRIIIMVLIFSPLSDLLAFDGGRWFEPRRRPQLAPREPPPPIPSPSDFDDDSPSPTLPRVADPPPNERYDFRNPDALENEEGEGFKQDELPADEQDLLQMYGSKSYSGPGEYKLYPGDKIYGKNFWITLEKVGPSTTSLNKAVTLKRQVYLSPSGQAYQDTVTLWPFSTIPWFIRGDNNSFQGVFGIYYAIPNIFLEGDGNDDYVPVKIYDSCLPIYNECLSMATAGLPKLPKDYSPEGCLTACPADAPLPGRISVQSKNIIVSMPTGYEEAAELALQNAQNCYQKLEQFTGLPSSRKIPIIYSLYDTSDIYKGNGCGWGLANGNVYCTVSPHYNNENIKKHELYNYFVEAINKGICLNNKDGTPFGGQIHEMTHTYTYYNAAAMNSEGMSRLAENLSVSLSEGVVGEGDGVAPIWGPIYFPVGFGCYEDYVYSGWSPGNYKTGECLLKDFIKMYGEASFKKLFLIARDLKADPTDKKYYYFKDLFNKAAGDNFFEKVKTKFSTPYDIPITGLNVQYSFD